MGVPCCWSSSASIRTAREVFRSRKHLKGCAALVGAVGTRPRQRPDLFFKNLRRKYVGHLARTLKKKPPADLTQGGEAMQSLENKKASLLFVARERQHFRRCL